MSTTNLFELTLCNMKRLNAFTKMCEAISAHSDTAQFKLKKTGLFIDITDCENLCTVECRIPDKIFQCVHFSNPKTDRWCTKIQLEHFNFELRRALRMKETVTFFADPDQPDVLKLRTTEHTLTIKSTNHRPRVYHIVSIREFIAKSSTVAHFRLLNAELVKIINVQCVISGNHGGVGELRIKPEGGDRCTISFHLRSNCAANMDCTIHTHKTSAVAPVVKMPAQELVIKYFLMYLKRSQGLFAVPQDLTHFYVSEKGMMLQTEANDTHDTMSAVVFIPDISAIDLDSYV